MEAVDDFDFESSAYLNDLRKQFDLDQQPGACSACWNVEKHGHKSRRQSAIEFFQDSKPDYEVKLQGIDHSATWACNLACIMCGPYNSSLWATEKKLNKSDLTQLGRSFQKNNNILNKLNLTQVKKIHFNGGEPMLNNDQTNLLIKLEQQGILENLFISYNTNGTVMPSKKIMELWSKARLVKLFFSIDATGDAFEYIRWPGNWQQTSRNMLEMKNNLPDNVMFGFNVTVGSYNLMELPDLYDWFDQNLATNRAGGQSDFCWQLANNFDPQELPRQAKVDAISQLAPLDKFSGIIKYLESTLNQNEDLSWIKTLAELDKQRNTNWRTTLKVSQYLKDKNC
jgi:sulfatase maturation enzyme AslB (radical SAM superfamily)